MGKLVRIDRLINQLLWHLAECACRSPEGAENGYRVFAKQMTNPPAACGLSIKSTIDKAATTKSVREDTNRCETPK